MKSASTGTVISKTEVVDISPFGIWLIHRDQEYFLAYESFPWFRNAPVQQVFEVIAETETSLRWPALDIDLSLESIQEPEKYPLVYHP